ncbi:MAG: ABC transporter substrate-binding protein [Rhizobiaceae bacterium]|nr:ABC transporter substrate-binding protein [Rhizobiaceae bacterium]
MKTKLITTACALALAYSIAHAGDHSVDPVKIGILMGFTGPVESLTPDMSASAELAFGEVSKSGLFLNGRTIESVRGDSTCTDSAAATTAAERLVSSEKVAAILGAACSGATGAVVAGVAVPNGILTLSPSATSPGLSTISDNSLFYRTAPSDARQGEVLAQITIAKGITEIAVTYTNNDYGKGLADSFTKAFEALGGTASVTVPHEDGKGDYSAEVGALSSTGASHLLVIGYIDQGGRQIIRQSLDLGAFERFVLSDGMIGDALMKELGSQLEGSFGTVPGSDNDASKAFDALAKKAGISGSGPFRGESYDAAAVIALAIQSAGTADRSLIAEHVAKVANAPGEKIRAGELAKALKILSEGGDVDYVGVSNVEFDEAGDAAGTYRELLVTGGEFQTTKVW